MNELGNKVCRGSAQASFYVFLQIEVRNIQIQHSSPGNQGDNCKAKEAVVDGETARVVEASEYTASCYDCCYAQEKTNRNL